MNAHTGKSNLMQEVVNTLAYGVRSIEANLAEADAALTHLEKAEALEAAQDWVELARHYSLHPNRHDQFLVCRILEVNGKPVMVFAATSNARKAWKWGFSSGIATHFIARNGIILAQHKDAPVKPAVTALLAPALSPRFLQAIQRAQRMIGGAE